MRDEINSLPDLARYANTNMNLSVSASTISGTLRQYNIVSYRAPRKPRIKTKQRPALVAIGATNICLGVFKIGQG